MDFFDFGNLTACCTCARKDDSLQQSGQNDYYKRGDDKTGAAKVGRVEKPQLGGVGIVFQGTENGGLMVSSIMANGPAAASGLVQEGDLLVSVNGVSIDGMTDRKFSCPACAALLAATIRLLLLHILPPHSRAHALQRTRGAATLEVLHQAPRCDSSAAVSCSSSSSSRLASTVRALAHVDRAALFHVGLLHTERGGLLGANGMPGQYVCLAEQLARNLLGPLGSKVTLGLERPNGNKFDAELSRAFTSKQRATAVSDVNKGS